MQLVNVSDTNLGMQDGHMSMSGIQIWHLKVFVLYFQAIVGVVNNSSRVNQHTAGLCHTMKVDNSPIERVEEFKYLGKTLTNQILFRKKLRAD